MNEKKELKNEEDSNKGGATEKDSGLNSLLCKSDCAVFAYSESGFGEYIEQLTNWSTLESAIKSKDNWFQKDRHLFIFSRINT